MQVSNHSTLPAHILSALQGNLIALNTIAPPAERKSHKALTNTPVSINLSSVVTAIDDIYNDGLEVHSIEGDNSHVSLE